MQNKSLVVFVCLALLVSHSAYAQVPGGENSRDCANYDHCADRVESNYRWKIIACTTVSIIGVVGCAGVSAGVGAITVGAGFAISIACGIYVGWRSDVCKSNARSTCRRGLRTCQTVWNTTGRCYSNACD